jgi:hypothetical protein
LNADRAPQLKRNVMLLPCKLVRGFIRVVLVCGLLALTCCEFDPQAKLMGGNPPVFSVWSGTGNLLFISIREYRADESLNPSERSIELWRVEATRDKSGQLMGRRASDVDKVTYGIVPDGYRQIIPASGNPPALVEGKNYSYDFETAAGMPATGNFEIRAGRAIVVNR